MPDTNTIEPTAEAVEFFRVWGNVSWDPATETEDEGRRRGAREAAEAEAWGRSKSLEVVWMDDWLVDHQKEFDCYSDGGPTTCQMAVIEYKGTVVASLGCIDDATDEYRRVVVADLFAEARAEVERLDRTVKVEVTFVLDPYDLKRFQINDPASWDWGGFLELAEGSEVTVRRVDL